MSTHTLKHTCCNKSEVLTVSEMRAEQQTEEKNLPLRQWQNEIDSQMRLKEIEGGSAVKTGVTAGTGCTLTNKYA